MPESILTLMLVLILVPGLAVGVFRLAEQRDRNSAGQYLALHKLIAFHSQTG